MIDLSDGLLLKLQWGDFEVGINDGVDSGHCVKIERCYFTLHGKIDVRWKQYKEKDALHINILPVISLNPLFVTVILHVLS